MQISYEIEEIVLKWKKLKLAARQTAKGYKSFEHWFELCFIDFLFALETVPHLGKFGHGVLARLISEVLADTIPYELDSDGFPERLLDEKQLEKLRKRLAVIVSEESEKESEKKGVLL